MIAAWETKEAPDRGFSSGPSRARTGDLRAASATLSQLSYGPEELGQCSSELVIARPLDSRDLAVPRRRESQLHARSENRKLLGQQVTALRRPTVRGDRIDLVLTVSTRHDPVWAAPTRSTNDHHHRTPADSPFALNPHKLWPKIEDQVVAFIAERARYPHAVRHCLERNRLFGEGAFLVCRQH
jgi:hypothetical protein